MPMNFVLHCRCLRMGPLGPFQKLKTEFSNANLTEKLMAHEHEHVAFEDEM